MSQKKLNEILEKARVNKSCRKASKPKLEALFGVKSPQLETEEADNYQSLYKLDSSSIESILNDFKKTLEDVPTDQNNLLTTLDDCQNLLASLKPLGEIIIPRKYHETVNFVKVQREKIKATSNQLIEDTHLNHAKLFTLYYLKQLVFILNQLIVKPKMSYTEVKLVLNSVSPIVKTESTPKKIPVNDLTEILKGISQTFPEFNPPKKPKRRKPNNKSYKLKDNELSPNSPQSNDVLSAIVKPHQWTDENDSIEYFKEHKNNKGYSRLSIFKPNKANYQINPENPLETIIDNFDWKDRKILRVLMTEAIQHKGQPFTVSGKWLLKLIGDNRNVRVNGKRLTSKEKLEDLLNRFKRYDSIWYFWKCTVGKKEFAKLPDGHPLQMQLKVFNIDKIFLTKEGKGYDLTAEISPGSWFEFNQKVLQQYTRIPKKLLTIDTTKNWRAYALGERICVLYRFNKERFLKSSKGYQNPVTINIKTLLDEIIPPEEIDYALSNSCKGTRLKQAIIKDTVFLNKLLGWQFEWRFNGEGEGFNSFYNSAAFKVILDPELEAEILGEKVIKKITNKTPLFIEGELIRNLRKKLKLTQAKFAEVLGYSRTYITKIEKGDKQVSEDFIKVICKHYKQELEELQK